MSNSRVIFDIKARTETGGRRSVLARYIAESELDHRREGRTPRPLFSDRADALTYWEAEQLITRGRGVAAKEDIKHMVLSLRPRDYELLGADDEERSPQGREIAREVMRAIGDARDVSYLKWYAGIHLNKRNPHIHFGLGKNAIDRATGRPVRLEHIPEQLLTRNKMNERGDKETFPGQIASLVGEELDRRHRERIRFLQFADRSSPKEVRFTRELVAAETLRKRAPTAQERLVGRLLVAEFDAAYTCEEAEWNDGRDDKEVPEGREKLEVLKRKKEEQLNLLRTEVARLDRGSLEGGSERVAAYLHPQELRRVLHAEKNDFVIGAFADAPAADAEDSRRRRDARSLGEALVARGEIAHFADRIENLTAHGRFRQWKVYDQTHARERRVSESSVQARASALARREMRGREFDNPALRDEFSEARYEKHLAAHSRTLSGIKNRASNELADLNDKLSKAGEKYAVLRTAVLEIKERYGRSGQPLPVPYVTAEEINRLQDQAVEKRDAALTRDFEEARRHSAEERGEAARGDYERGRLAAQMREASVDLRVREERLQRFERQRHVTSWDVGDAEEWSLARVAREEMGIQRKYGNAGLFGFLPPVKNARHAETERLAMIEEKVLAWIDARRAELTHERDQTRATTEALDEIHAANERQGAPVETRRSVPLVATKGELSHLHQYAAALQDGELLKKVDELEREQDACLSPADRRGAEALAARAVARQVIAEIEARDAHGRLTERETWLPHTPLLLKDAQGRDRVTTLAEWEAHTLAAILLLRATEDQGQRAMRLEVGRASALAREQAGAELARAENYLAASQEVTRSYRTLLAQEGKNLPLPEFTAKELNRIDLYAASLGDGAEQVRYYRLLDAAEERQLNHEGTARARSAGTNLEENEHIQKEFHGYAKTQFDEEFAHVSHSLVDDEQSERDAWTREIAGSEMREHDRRESYAGGRTDAEPTPEREVDFSIQHSPATMPQGAPTTSGRETPDARTGEKRAEREPGFELSR